MDSGKKTVFAMAVLLVAALTLALASVGALAAAPAAPTDLKVQSPDAISGGVLQISWQVEKASTVKAYRIYRSERDDGGFEMVHEEPVAMDSGTVMDHIDTGLTPKKTYYYKVALVGKDGKAGAASKVAKGTAPEKGMTGGYTGKHIIISIADQTAYFLEDDTLVKSHLVSTGTDSHPTPCGVFSVLYHAQIVVSEKYGGWYCPYWLGFAEDTGMHGLPYDPDTGEKLGASTLGQKASHGCVRQADANAQWAYNWAPNGIRIDITPLHWEWTPPPPPPPPVRGGHASQGISNAAYHWYFAEGYTGGGFNEYVLMMNPNGTTADVTAWFMKPDGSVVSMPFAVPAFSRATVHVDDISGLDNAEVSVHLQSSELISAERAMYFYDFNGKDGGTCSAGVSETATTWYLAEGYTGGEFDEFILVQNPGGADGTVMVEYMLPNGATLVRPYGILAHSRLSIHVDDIPELVGAEVSAKVTCDQPVVVERSQYFNYYNKEDGNASAAVRAPARQWYLAEGYTGGEFDEYVLIQNPGPVGGNAHVTFMLGDGSQVVQDYGLPPYSRFTIHVDDLPGLSGCDVSTLVETDVDSIVERAMYFNSYNRPGGADAPGVNTPAQYWYLAEGYTGGEFDTYVLLMNPNGSDVTADISFLRTDGSTVGLTVAVPAHTRYTIHTDEIPELSNAEFATAVTGSQPIIVERAMYFSIPR
ncbi:MAG: L,D-transpeptidase [Actinobacteria bacterium]|nr:L,D-transpeptidase [Actinomycetota bacterium]MBU1945287.1 L,D-transpeptidase [Actinomycetota bacterium]MBU2686487.1 L,D-transpeptidase [Actinomycetota bacterium]